MSKMRKIKMALKRRLWPLCGVGYGSFGKRSIVYRPILISGKRNIFIGKGVTIIEGARIEVVKSGNKGARIVVGDNTTFEQNVHITSGGNLIIGHDNSFASGSLITNIIHDYSKINVSSHSQRLIIKDTIIGDYCVFGADSKVFPGVCIGNNCIIGANSIVMDDIPDYSVVVGAPARIVKRYDFEKQIWVKVE